MPNKNAEKLVTLEEITSLREEISQMHASLAHDVLVHAPLVHKVSNLFIDKGLDRRWVEKLLAPLVGSTFENDEMILLAYILEELDTFLNVIDESKSFKRKVMIMVGGTGIGKTSLVGKLGGRYAYLLKHAYRVAFVNFDQHKVGAVEQLAHYADAMEIPLIELDSLLENHYDVVLIDTAGSMGENFHELRELISILEEEMEYSVEISLVLSATSKAKDMNRVLDSFCELDIKSFIFTKLDETSDLSDMIKFLMQHHDTPLSYLSFGQEIPEDLMVATKEYILNKFMNEK